MVTRHFWLEKIAAAWHQRSVIWLSGVRRSGKTFLCRSIPGAEYFDCELARCRRMMEDTESFLEKLREKTVVIDEIHRLGNPSELLKIAADYFPDIKIIATGSSSLGASVKFKDTLTGRKNEIFLTPMVADDLQWFGNRVIEFRLHRGGLPPFFLEKEFPEKYFQEWIDDYWSKDIQELFRIERKYSFQRFLELLMINSGGIFEATKFASPCEVSRTTISNYLEVLENTFVVHIIRPYNSNKSSEIISAPKVYAFDTGFVSYFRGWDSLRNEDLGILWEHYVINEIIAQKQTRQLLYWRNKRGHEVDFIWLQRGKSPVTIECKWSANHFEPENIAAFRRQYPNGKNYVVTHDVDRTYQKQYDSVSVEFVSLSRLINEL